jgi:hypothetical protein
MNPFVPQDSVPLTPHPDGCEPGLWFAGEHQIEGP